VVLPVRDINPVRRTPVVTYALLLLNVVVFVLSPLALAPLLGDASGARECSVQAYLDHWAAVPGQVIGDDPPAQVVTGPGPREGTCVAESPPPYDKRPFVSVLTAMFVHGGWLHLLGNMLFLYVFGNNVEDRLGRLRFLAFYLGCGYAATYGFSLADVGSDTPLVGASGAIAGVLGAYLVLFPRAKVWSLLTFFFFLPVRLPAWLVLGSWFVLQYLYTRGAGLQEASEGGGVAYLAHVLGFLVGVALVWRLRGTGYPKELAPPRYGPRARP
jgi:membrane associated rhomboid family serine protease